MGGLKRKSWSLLQVAGASLAIVIVASIAFVSWRYWLFKGGVFKTSSFNEKEWKSSNKKSDDFSCYRGGMAYDIQTNILRPGQSRSDVEELLGKPDRDQGSVHEYLLGMCSGLQFDFDTLDVHFNSEGKLVGVYVVQH